MAANDDSFGSNDDLKHLIQQLRSGISSVDKEDRVMYDLIQSEGNMPPSHLQSLLDKAHDNNGNISYSILEKSNQGQSAALSRVHNKANKILSSGLNNSRHLDEVGRSYISVISRLRNQAAQAMNVNSQLFNTKTRASASSIISNMNNGNAGQSVSDVLMNAQLRLANTQLPNYQNGVGGNYQQVPNNADAIDRQVQQATSQLGMGGVTPQQFAEYNVYAHNHGQAPRNSEEREAAASEYERAPRNFHSTYKSLSNSLDPLLHSLQTTDDVTPNSYNRLRQQYSRVMNPSVQNAISGGNAQYQAHVSSQNYLLGLRNNSYDYLRHHGLTFRNYGNSFGHHQFYYGADTRVRQLANQYEEGSRRTHAGRAAYNYVYSNQQLNNSRESVQRMGSELSNLSGKVRQASQSFDQIRQVNQRQTNDRRNSSINASAASTATSMGSMDTTNRYSLNSISARRGNIIASRDANSYISSANNSNPYNLAPNTGVSFMGIGSQFNSASARRSSIINAHNASIARSIGQATNFGPQSSYRSASARRNSIINARAASTATNMGSMDTTNRYSLRSIHARRTSIMGSQNLNNYLNSVNSHNPYNLAPNRSASLDYGIASQSLSVLRSSYAASVNAPDVARQRYAGNANEYNLQDFPAYQQLMTTDFGRYVPHNLNSLNRRAVRAEHQMNFTNAETGIRGMSAMREYTQKYGHAPRNEVERTQAMNEYNRPVNYRAITNGTVRQLGVIRNNTDRGIASLNNGSLSDTQRSNIQNQQGTISQMRANVLPRLIRERNRKQSTLNYQRAVRRASFDSLKSQGLNAGDNTTYTSNDIGNGIFYNRAAGRVGRLNSQYSYTKANSRKVNTAHSYSEANQSVNETSSSLRQLRSEIDTLQRALSGTTSKLNTFSSAQQKVQNTQSTHRNSVRSAIRRDRRIVSRYLRNPTQSNSANIASHFHRLSEYRGYGGNEVENFAAIRYATRGKYNSRRDALRSRIKRDRQNGTDSSNDQRKLESLEHNFTKGKTDITPYNHEELHNEVAQYRKAKGNINKRYLMNRTEMRHIGDEFSNTRGSRVDPTKDAHMTMQANRLFGHTDENGYVIQKDGTYALNRNGHRYKGGIIPRQINTQRGLLQSDRDSQRRYASRQRSIINRLHRNPNVNFTSPNRNIHEGNLNSHDESVLERLANSANASPDERNDAREYTNLRHSLEKNAEEIDKLTRQINNQTNDVNTERAEQSSYESSKTGDPYEAAIDPSKTYKSAPIYTMQGILQRMGGRAGILSGMGFAGVRNLVSRVGQGNQVRQGLEPGINSLTLGRALNGGDIYRHEDNHVTDRLNHLGAGIGETPQQMSEYLGAAASDRNTHIPIQEHVADNMARFSRYNNVNSQTTSELYSNLGMAGGLGRNPSHNSLEFYRQFAGMLHNDHLGGVSNQQAQGLSSIFGGMIGSGQTVTPAIARSLMGWQSQLSSGRNGQVFQGQQGARQLQSFSQGVSSQFNDMLVRNAFAGNSSKYGGQEGLYKLQMDMQEPLKHPARLNSMIQNLARSGLGAAGTEEKLVQMGLSPDAARKIYSESMNGRLNPSSIKRVTGRDRRQGSRTAQHAHHQYDVQGNSTLDIKVAMNQRGQIRSSESMDTGRRLVNNVLRRPSSSHGFLSDVGAFLGGGASMFNNSNLGTLAAVWMGAHIHARRASGQPGVFSRVLHATTNGKFGRIGHRIGGWAKRTKAGRWVNHTKLGRHIGNWWQRYKGYGSSSGGTGAAGRVNASSNTFRTNYFYNNHFMDGGLGGSSDNGGPLGGDTGGGSDSGDYSKDGTPHGESERLGERAKEAEKEGDYGKAARLRRAEREVYAGTRSGATREIERDIARHRGPIGRFGANHLGHFGDFLARHTRGLDRVVNVGGRLGTRGMYALHAANVARGAGVPSHLSTIATRARRARLAGRFARHAETPSHLRTLARRGRYANMARRFARHSGTPSHLSTLVHGSRIATKYRRARDAAKVARGARDTAKGVRLAHTGATAARLGVRAAGQVGKRIPFLGAGISGAFALSDLAHTNRHNFGTHIGQAIGDASEAIPGLDLLPMRTIGGIVGYTASHPIKATKRVIHGIGSVGHDVLHPLQTAHRVAKSRFGHIAGHIIRHPWKSLGHGIDHLDNGMSHLAKGVIGAGGRLAGTLLGRGGIGALRTNYRLLTLINRMLPSIANRLSDVFAHSIPSVGNGSSGSAGTSGMQNVENINKNSVPNDTGNSYNDSHDVDNHSHSNNKIYNYNLAHSVSSPWRTSGTSPAAVKMGFYGQHFDER